MFAICVEASHSKGMGHLFRMLNFAKYLKEKGNSFVFIVNDNDKTKDILKANSINFEVIDLEDFSSDWESNIIEKYNVLYWINDRLDTNKHHSIKIQNSSIKLITFDDLGSGAKLSDLNICGLFFNKNNIDGKKTLKGVEYLILNNEIDLYKKQRNKINNILVTLGGSDTYGVTVKVLRLLKKYNIKATIHTGPSFAHKEALAKELTKDYNVITFVPSFIKELKKYDLAITGGGITPFEANASGLPCLIIANEPHEINNAKYLNSIESSKFIGMYIAIEESNIKDIFHLNISTMSQNGLKNLDTNAVKNIYKKIIQL